MAESTGAPLGAILQDADYSRVFDTLGIGVSVFPLGAMDPVAVNDALLGLLGYSREQFAAGTIDWKAVALLDEFPDADTAAMRQANATRQIRVFDRELLCGDGTRAPVRVAGVLLEAEFIALVQDIRNEKCIASRLQAIHDSGMIGVVVSNSGGMIAANDALLAMIGHIREDFEAGRIPWSERTLFEEYGAGDVAAIARIDAGEQVLPYEKELLHANGARIPIELIMMRTGGPDNERIALIADISARKRAELASMRSEARFRRIFDSETMAVAFGDTNGNLHEVNDAYLKGTSKNRAFLIG